MATALDERSPSNHIMTEEFSPEPEHPPIVSSNTSNSSTAVSTLSRQVISFDISVTESLSQPDILERTDETPIVQLDGGGNLVPSMDLSQPILSEDSFIEPDEKSLKEEEEMKLVDWVMTMYVPSCKSLLERCQMMPRSSVNLEELRKYLKLLSNAITFFCNEHQQREKDAVSPSKRFTGLNSVSPNFGSTLSPPTSITYRVDRDSQSQTGVAVKVLRSISSSLLPPLLREAASGQFTDKLFRDIVVAIQKISWKVEACLSFCSTVDMCNVHEIVFSKDVVSSDMREVMIASPPEEMKIQNSPAHLAVMGLKEEIILDADMEEYWERQNDSNSRVGGKGGGYFRPAGRRTTVSISKRQVQSLGLNVVDATAPDSLSPKRSNTVGLPKNSLIQGETTEDFSSIRDRVLKKLAKEFPQFQTESDDSNENLSKRPSTLPVNSTNSTQIADMEYRSSSAPLPPINQGPIRSHIRLRERHSHEPPSTIAEERVSPRSPSTLGERTKSLDFEKVEETSSTMSPTNLKATDLVQSASPSRISKSNSNTMPTKRRETFVKLVKKKARSFGRADSRVKQKSPMYTRNSKHSSEFFASEDETVCSESPIEQFVLKLHPRELTCKSSDYLHFLKVEVLDKTSLSSPRRRRFSVSTSKSLNVRQPAMAEMRVTTDIPDLKKDKYVIQRSLKDIVTLYDLLQSTTVTAGCLPERPDKRCKDWRFQVEEFFEFVASSPELRTVPEFVSFMKPEGMNAEDYAILHRDSEFELITTFFTPLTYLTGLPGTHHEVEVVGKDASTPVLQKPPVRRSYPSISNARGSIHVRKSDGDEEATFIIREDGKDVLIISEDQDRFVVVAGTFKKLVEQLACEEKPDPRYVSTFLLGHRHFSSSEDLVKLLTNRFKITEAPDATEEELAYVEKWRYVIQLRVLDIISYWMKSYWNDFQRSPQALSLLQEFIDELRSSEDANFSSAAISMYSTMNNKLSTPTRSKHRHSSSSSSSLSPTHSSSISPMHKPPLVHSISTSDVHTFSGIQLARQLTLIELDFLRAIDVYELAFYTWGSSEEGRQYRQNLDAYIARFNKISYWVASEILNHQDERQRGVVIEKFIDVAKHSQELRNFNTTVSVVTGLSLTCVRRLEKSWKHVSERALRAFNKLKGLITPSNNHSEYRKALGAVSKEACIPYFGVFMRDVTLCNEGTPKKLKNGLYNFSKLRTLVMMFEDIKRYQRSKFQFPSDDRAQMFCMNIWSLEEHVLYEISRVVEPREDPVISEDQDE